MLYDWYIVFLHVALAFFAIRSLLYKDSCKVKQDQLDQVWRRYIALRNKGA
jgi:hypothetical protein